MVFPTGTLFFLNADAFAFAEGPQRKTGTIFGSVPLASGRGWVFVEGISLAPEKKQPSAGLGSGIERRDFRVLIASDEATRNTSSVGRRRR